MAPSNYIFPVNTFAIRGSRKVAKGAKGACPSGLPCLHPCVMVLITVKLFYSYLCIYTVKFAINAQTYIPQIPVPLGRLLRHPTNKRPPNLCTRMCIAFGRHRMPPQQHTIRETERRRPPHTQRTEGTGGTEVPEYTALSNSRHGTKRSCSLVSARRKRNAKIERRRVRVVLEHS